MGQRFDELLVQMIDQRHVRTLDDVKHLLDERRPMIIRRQRRQQFMTYASLALLFVLWLFIMMIVNSLSGW